MDDAAPRKGTVTQRAVEEIKAMIAEGRLEPGQRLPTERDLAVQLGMSRSSTREAIRALTVMGVLDARHGSGIYVGTLEAGDLLESFGVVADLSRGRAWWSCFRCAESWSRRRPRWPPRASPRSNWLPWKPTWRP